MEERRLISMVDYTIMCWNNHILNTNVNDNDLRILMAYNCNEYAKFLQTQLNIGMFVPAKFENGKWVVLEEPLYWGEWLAALSAGYDHYYDGSVLRQYQQALDNVLFEGFKFDHYENILETKDSSFEYNDYQIEWDNGYYNECQSHVLDMIEFGVVLTEKAYNKYFK